MKISKKSVLIMGGILCTASFGLLYVSADRELFMNPRNAIQYMENVKFIDETSDTTATLKKSIYNDFLRIETNNLILGDAGNSIESNVNNSSILGGKSNTIKMGSKDNVIIGGSENTIQRYTVGNTIIGGNNNMVSGGSYLTIIGGNHNETNGHFNTIIGGSNNKYTHGVDNSVIMGNDSSVGGNNSVALGSSSNIEANNSFLWTDGSSSDTLTNDNVFAIMASNGAIIDTDEAHSSAKLTLGKSLILSKNENQSSITCGGGKGGGIIKIEKSEDANQMCLCSCDGHGWNSVSKGSCINVCNNGTSTETESAKCGNQISRICTEQGITTYSGSCDSGNVIEGTGAYFVDKNNIVHRSCQGDDGTIASCTGSINQSQCIQVTSTFSCTNPPANAVLITGSDQNLTANTPGQLYSGVTAAGNSRCAYICDNTHIYTGYNGGTCITKSSTYSCTGTVSAYATLIPGSDQGLTGNTTRTLYPNATAANGKKCAYLCNSETHEYKNGDCKAKPGVHECKKNPPLPEHATLWFPDIMPSNSSKRYTYSAAEPITESLKPCAFHCDTGYSYDRVNNECIENVCQGVPPDHSVLWFPNIKPDNYITPYKYRAEAPITESLKACKYHCDTGYSYDRAEEKCIKKQEGASYLQDGVNINSAMQSFSTILFIKNFKRSPTKPQPGQRTKSISVCHDNINRDVRRNGYLMDSSMAMDKPDSCLDTVIWLDGQTIYYYTEATKIYMHPDSFGIFRNFKYLEDISGLKDFDTSYVDNMSMMFYNCSKLADISAIKGWNTSNVRTMNAMFENCSKLTDISAIKDWNTNKVKDMSFTFYNCSSLENIDLSNWNTEKVTQMSATFADCKNLKTLDISSWNTYNVTGMFILFENCPKLQTIYASNKFTTNKVENDYLFDYDNNSLIGGRGTSLKDTERSDTDGSYTKKYAKIDCGPNSNYAGYFSSRTEEGYTHCPVCSPDYNGQSFEELSSSNNLCSDGTVTDFDNSGSDKYTWQCKKGEITIDCSANKEELEGETYLEYGMEINKSMRKLAFKYGEEVNHDGSTYLLGLAWDFNNSYNTNIKAFKRAKTNLTLSMPSNEYADISYSGQPVYIRYDNNDQTIYYYTKAKTIYIDSAPFMFQNLRNLIDISGLSELNTSKTTNFGEMFFRCESLTDISPISNWDTSNTLYMHNMFSKCKNLEDISPLSNRNTSSVTSMQGMFGGCDSLTDISPISNWNTKNVTSMGSMFLSCNNLEDISPISNWDTSNVTNMEKMFYETNIRTANLKWNTSNVIDMDSMFNSCSNLTTIDLSNWDTNNVKDSITENFDRMFALCRNLRTIYVSDRFKKAFRGTDMFAGDELLEGGNGTKYINTDNGKSGIYARIDGRDGKKGYFTYKEPSS